MPHEDIIVGVAVRYEGTQKHDAEVSLLASGNMAKKIKKILT